MIIVIRLFIAVIWIKAIVTAVRKFNNSRKEKAAAAEQGTRNRRVVLETMLNNHFITGEQFENVNNACAADQVNFINMQMAQMNEMQQFYMAEQMRQMQEIQHMMSTGIEFGGFNPDLNLNPGMQMMDQQMMNQNPF